MGKKNKKKKNSVHKNERTIGENRKARHDYEVLETLECGIQLLGSEVKSLRDGKVTLAEAYARLDGDELFLVGCDIPVYGNTSDLMNHEPRRRRKLLLHRQEIIKFAQKSTDKGFSLVPLKMYFKHGRAKILIGIAKGRQSQDKREKLKGATAKRDISRAMRARDWLRNSTEPSR